MLIEKVGEPVNGSMVFHHPDFLAHFIFIHEIIFRNFTVSNETDFYINFIYRFRLKDWIGIQQCAAYV